MMAVGIECVLSICIVFPLGIGEEFVLRLIGPIEVFSRLNGIFADHFLHENQIGFEESKCLAKPVKYKTPVAPGKTFMDIDCYYA